LTRRRGAVRAVIADDEPLARERLRVLLAERGGIDLVAECATGVEAVAAVEREKPELLFLDVQMPELDGFGALEILGASMAKKRMPRVIFVTAFDDYALRAFDVNAVDYLLKPFDRARFETAVARALDRVNGDGRTADTDAHDELRGLLAQLRAERDAMRKESHSLARGAARFVVRSGGKLHLVKADDVDWIDADGNYVRLHVAGKAYLVRDKMKSIEARLDPGRFMRVHRSAIVNIDRIATLEPYFHGEYIVTMRDGARVTSSRTHSAGLRTLLRADERPDHP
jgi:two-component system LytT family response regulator